MNDNFTGEQLQEELENVRLRLLEALAPLLDEAFYQPEVAGPYALRDWLFLLTAWEAELVTGLMKVLQGKKPERLLNALAGRSHYETARLAENQNRDLDLIFNDLQGVRIELEDWLVHFDDKTLNDRQKYRWLAGRSLAELIAETSYQYENEQLPAIEQYATAWEIAEQEAPAVMLEAIEVNYVHDNN